MRDVGDLAQEMAVVNMSDARPIMNIELMKFAVCFYVGCERGKSTMMTKLPYENITLVQVIYMYDKKITRHKKVYNLRYLICFP